MARICAVGLLAYGILVGAEKGYDYATTSPRFEVRGLIYTPTPHIDDTHLRDLLGLTPGTNILSLDLDTLAGRIAEDPWVAEATVVRVLPDTLEVRVEEEEAAAVLLAGSFYLVNDEGIPFKALGDGERERLPVVTGIEPLALLQDPQGVQERIRRGLEVLAAYEQKQRPLLSEVHVDEDLGVTLYTANKGSQLRVGRGSVTDALARYDALRAALGSDSDKLAVAHLDATQSNQGSDRVVASFFEAESPPAFVAEVELARAAALAEDEAKDEPVVARSNRKPSRMSRLPRYE